MTYVDVVVDSEAPPVVVVAVVAPSGLGRLNPDPDVAAVDAAPEVVPKPTIVVLVPTNGVKIIIIQSLKIF